MGILTCSTAQADAFQKLTAYYADFFGSPTTKFGLRPNAITDPEQIRQLTAFFNWSAWAGSTLRPHKNYSYTNNLQPESLVDNHATAEALIWSVLSLVTLLGGIGLLLAAFGRWNFLGWHGAEEQRISFRPPDEVCLRQRNVRARDFFSSWRYCFLCKRSWAARRNIIARKFQTFLVSISREFCHSTSPAPGICNWRFSGSPRRSRRRNFSRADDHGREPRGQGGLAYALLGALALVVFGSMAGEYAGVFGWIQNGWSWFGHQGFTFLDLAVSGKFC